MSKPESPPLSGLSADEKRRMLARLLSRGAAPSPAVPASPVASPRRFAPSAAQRRLWFIEQLAPGQAGYHIPAALRLEGPLAIDQLAQALNGTIARHEILRARFHADAGEPWIGIPPAATLSLEPQRLSQFGAESTARRVEIEATLRELVAAPFDLAAGQLLRARLLAVGPDDHVLLLCVHHIVADYWSLRVLMREIAALYSGASLPPLALQYVDYAAWQQGRETQLAEQLAYWTTQLADPPPSLQLPLDRPRRATQRGRGARHAFTLSPALSADLQALAKASHASLFATLLAAFQALLARYTGQDDVWVGSTISNRDRPELRDLVGLFVNNVVLRTRIAAEQSFSQLLPQVRDTVLAAFAHQELPFEQVVDALRIERRLDRHPLFQVSFVLHNTPQQAVAVTGLRFSAVEADAGTTRFDLALDITESNDGLHGSFEFDTDLFDADTIVRLTARFEALLAAIAADPARPLADHDLLNDAERHQVAAWNATGRTWPQGDVSDLFNEHVLSRPEHLALTVAGQHWSYAQLAARVQEITQAMAAHGVVAGDPVGLCLPRSADLVAALLACLAQGAVYIPLDPQQPAPRLRAMLLDANARLALVSSPAPSLADALPCPSLDLAKPWRQARGAPARASQPLSPDALAYVIFTSGTTGRPKGVPITRGALLNLLRTMAQAPGMAAGQAWLAVTTIAFDIATLELLLPLTVGARLVLADRDTAADGHLLAGAIEHHGITHLQATPAGWRVLLESGWPGQSGLVMLCGGEALDRALAQQLLARGGALWNVYGPTETTIWSAALQVRTEHLDGHAVPIGGAIANTSLHVLDALGHEQPIGIAGELCIGGAGLSPGYLNQPELSAQRFELVAGQRLYRTGDLVRRRADGLFDYLGRSDHQLKLRGFRIEPGEIEAALLSHPGVSQALVMLLGHEPSPGAPAAGAAHAMLAAYLVPHTGHTLDPQALREHLGPRLPAYMVPGAFIPLTRFPLSGNGKVDRKALPLPGADTTAVTATVHPPGTPTERQLAALWSELLPMPVHDRHADFFALGGHSLLAARMMARLPALVGRAVPLRALFEQPTLAGLAEWIDRAGAVTTAGSPTSDPITPLTRGDNAPLSHAQQRLWVLAQLEPDSAFYNIAAALRVDGPLSVPLLERSLEQLRRRHDNLRSRFPADGGQPRLVIDGPEAVEIEWLRLEGHETAQALLARQAARPFDLANGPLLRVAVLPHQGHHLLLVVLHHILADAWSLRLLMRELVQGYEALRAGLTDQPAPLPLQYADYAAWQRRQPHAEQIQYWRHHLESAPALLDLPTDHPRPAAQRFVGASTRLRIGASTRDAIDRLGQQRGATLFMTLLASFKLLLSRYTGVADVVVGTPIGHRPQAELDQVIGLFANTLALRTQFDDCTGFGQLLDRVRDTVLGGFSHQGVPFDQVVDALQIERHWRHTPVFQAMFLWQPRVQDTLPAASGLGWTPCPLDAGATKFDLTLTLAEDADGIDGRVEYRSDLFEPSTMAHLAQAFVQLVNQLAHEPERPLSRWALTPDTQLAQLARWNDTDNRPSTHAATLHGRVLAQVARSPDAPAVRCGHDTLSYRQLDQRAARLAAHLQTLGVGAESRVGICLERRADLVVALLAVLKAGGAYVPLDPAYPAQRLAYIADDARITVLLTHGTARIDGLSPQVRVLDLGSAGQEVTAPHESPATMPVQASNLAYIIYTSGSTGRPKGVAIEHRQSVAMVDWALDHFRPAQLAGVLLGTSICFDLSVYEIFVPLACGGCVIVADDVLQLHALPARDQVTLVNTVPTAMAELLRLGPLPASVRTINLAGEPIPPALVRQLYADTGVHEVYNLYGPSEDTTYSTGIRLARDERGVVVPIGRPIDNTQAHVLDEHLQTVPIGMPGELYLAGAGVARGYWGRPALTAERFVPNPFARASHHDTLYRTGDRVRHRADGALEFLGRIDQQVKIRGFRIELGEVEEALRSHPAVVQAVASAHVDARGHQRLVAHVVPASGADTGTALSAALRLHLRERLPDFMVPAFIRALAELPRLPNGKLDRASLPAPQAADHPDALQATGPSDGELPATDTERQLAAIWRDVLGRTRVRRHDHFFELGGDSILAIQTISRAREAGLALVPRDLFLHPSLSALALHAASLAQAPLADHGPVVGDMAMTPAQRGFFELPLAHRAHWNQSILLKVMQPLDEHALTAAVEQLIAQHDSLRARFARGPEGVWTQHIDAVITTPLRIVHEHLGSADAAAPIVEHLAQEAQASLDLDHGPLWQLVYMTFDTPAGMERRLLMVFHHLLIDGVSWRILLADLQLLYRQHQARGTATALPRSSPVGHWVQTLQATLPAFEAERPYWQAQAAACQARLPRDVPHEPATRPELPEKATADQNLMRDADTVTLSLDAEQTRHLLESVPAAYPVRPDELMLAALLMAMRHWTGQPIQALTLEGHGRQDLPGAPPGLDLTRTLGWLTSFYPVSVDLGDAGPGAADHDDLLRRVKRELRQVPHGGLGWGVLRHLSAQPDAALACAPELRFNYLGQTDALFGTPHDPSGQAPAVFAPADERTGAARHPDDPRDVLIEVNAMVSRHTLKLHWTYSRRVHHCATIEQLAQACVNHLDMLITHCRSGHAEASHVPADFPLMDLDDQALSDLLDSL